MTVLLPMSERLVVTATTAERVPIFSVRTLPPPVLLETVVSPITSSSKLFPLYLVDVLELTKL